VLVDPHSPTRVFAGSAGAGLFLSADSGNSWRRTGNGLPVLELLSLASARTTPGLVYAATNGAGLYRSSDGGENFAASGSGMSDLAVQAVAVSPTDAAIVLAGTRDAGVFRSTDGGASWTYVFAAMQPVLIERGFSLANIQALAFAPDEADLVYAGSFGGGVFRSDDAGATWSPTGSSPNNSYVHTLSAGPGVLYAGTGGGGLVYRSDDGGVTWRAGKDGLPEVAVLSVLVDPTDTETVYVGSEGGGVFRSDDGGRSWDPLDNGLDSRIIYGLATHQRTPTTVFAATASSGAAGILQLRPFCGDAVLSGAEVCDLGADNGEPDSCCGLNCALRPTGTGCRAAGDACDLDEACDGAIPLCPPDSRDPTCLYCAGDCDDSRDVTVDEVITVVNIALGNSTLDTCLAGDGSGDGFVTVDEVLTAVNRALRGCQGRGQAR
jgi:photosystem II stability/assembly factor-like uncharacterized protein